MTLQMSGLPLEFDEAFQHVLQAFIADVIRSHPSCSRGLPATVGELWFDTMPYFPETKESVTEVTALPAFGGAAQRPVSPSTLCQSSDVPWTSREQSAPWFGVQKVARGGCFATPDLLLNLRGGEYRSFYPPTERPELAVGFRTCAL